MQDKNTSAATPRGGRVAIRSLSHKELAALLEELSQPRFRTRQVEEWLWQKGVSSFDDMTNLPKALRSSLSGRCTIEAATEARCQTSSDGTRKYLLRFSDGVRVECVGMPTGDKLTACVSAQAGCAMGCAFCATGRGGLSRNLSVGEIYEQVLHIRNDFGSRVTSVVFMGQGEPFMNYEATLSCLRHLNSKDGLGIGARHLTVSTCGILPQIMRFSNEPEQFTLAISLHSAVQKTRDALMPGVKKYSLIHLYDIMGEYVDKTGRRPTYEYALIRGINDTEEELASLVDFCRGTLCHVNLIRLNEVRGSRFLPSPDARIGEFERRLSKAGVEVTIRNSRGPDIDAACGQLSQKAGLS